MPATTVTSGSCLCGETKYTFNGSPVYTARCHCLDCRKISGGSNAVVFLIPRTELTYEEGSALKSKDLTHHSGDLGFTLNFCGSCGTAMHKEAAPWEGLAIVFTGNVEDGGALLNTPPQAELWTKLRVGWNAELKGAKQNETWDDMS